jgi:hypothetical protein
MTLLNKYAASELLSRLLADGLLDMAGSGDAIRLGLLGSALDSLLTTLVLEPACAMPAVKGKP